MEKQIKALEYILELLDMNYGMFNLTAIPQPVLDELVEEIPNIRSNDIKRVIGAKNKVLQALYEYAMY